MRIRKPRRLFCVTMIGLFFAAPSAAQISPPPGTVEVRYDGHPLYGDYPLFLYRGDAEFVDFDGRDRMDLVMTGLRDPLLFEVPTSAGYGGIFTHRSQPQQSDPGVWDTLRYYERRVLPGFTDFYNNSLAIGDHNNDGRPDIAASGRIRTDEFTPFSMLVEQVDSLTFDIREVSWLPVNRGSMAWGDYNNDGRSDMLITGQAPGRFVTRLYQNLGGGFFQDVAADLPNVGFGEAVWGDSDNDGDLDILICGVQEGGRFLSELFINDGGEFLRVGIQLPAIAFGHARWIDLNGDGLLDIILSGAEQSPFVLRGGIHFFLNRGGNVFEPSPRELTGHFDGDLDLIDWDTDGDIDILASGYVNPLGSRLARLYTNEEGEFEIGYAFVHVTDLFFATGDYDRDLDVDIFVTGYNPEPFTLVPPVAAFYEVSSGLPNEAPSEPTALGANVTASRVDLSWSSSTDAITPDPSLTYNLRVGSRPAGVDIVSPLSDPTSGKRFVCEQGNVFHNTSWHLESLPPGTYYWSVQAVDQSCVGSPFAAEGSFTVQADPTSAEAEEPHYQTDLEPSFPNPFVDEAAIGFSLAQPTQVTLAVYDVLGRNVRTLVDGPLSAGRHTAAWDGLDDQSARLASGLYILRLQAGQTALTQSVILVR